MSTTYTTLPTTGDYAGSVNTFGQPVNGNPADNPVGYGLDKGWIITSAGFVFLLVIGLGLMETGSIRRKNTRIVWYKILLNLVLTTWWWFILGFAWAFGDTNGTFIGAERFYAGGRWNEPLQGNGWNYYTAQYSHFIWRVAQAFVATTIATAIVTERVTLKAVAVFNLAMNMIILPFIFSWSFSGGFLYDDIGLIDYAGSWVIFGTGATAGLAGLLLIKPRYNRYGRYPTVIPVVPVGVSQVQLPHENNVASGPIGSAPNLNLPASGIDRMNQYQNFAPGTYAAPPNVPASTAFTAENIIRSRKRQDEDEYEYFGCTNYGRVALGTLLTIIGMIFLFGGQANGLQTARLYSYAEISAVIALLAASGAGLVSYLFAHVVLRKRPHRENAAFVCRAIVAGMVAAAAGANTYKPWVGLVSGMLGALSYVIMANLVYRLQLDDPCEFISVFGGPGFAGLIIAAFFNGYNGIFYDNSTTGEIIIWQMLSFGIMFAWAFLIAYAAWGLMRLLRGLRVGLKCEIVGYDYIDGARHLDFADQDSVFGFHKGEKLNKKNAAADAGNPNMNAGVPPSSNVIA
jgi:ammonia channel protein AmtB